MHQSHEDLDSLTPMNTFSIDRIFDDETMHPYVDMNDIEYYDPIDMGHKLADEYVTTHLTPLSPTLSSEELGNWRLNEVFQDIMDLESTPTMDEESPVNGSASLDSDDLFESEDLLAEAFASVSGCSNHTQDVPLATPDESELPLPLLECISGDIPSALSPDAADTGKRESGSMSLHKVSTKGKSKVKKAKKPLAKNKTAIVTSEVGVVTVKPHETRKDAVRRVKNNEASKVFRSRKKYRLEDLLVQEEKLGFENRQLQTDLDLVENMVKVLKDGLINNAKSFHH